MALSGVATFTYEILWTRLIGHVLGGSVAAFAIMLAGFLIGIAVGSAIAAKRAISQVSARYWFVLSQLGIACLSAFIYFMINASVPDDSGLLSNCVLAFSLLLPATLFIGATFPLAVRMLANDEKDAPAATARVYAWNTIGAIVGAKGIKNMGLNSQSSLSVLPVIARPEAKTMLVAGFGGGVAVERVPPSIKEVDVVELETKVIEANRLISSRRQHDPFTDSRLRIIYNDARNALLLTDKRYDIIVSQPSHPWTAGASHLYTQEFMQLAKSRLTENGVFLQWMNTDFTSEYLLKSLTATLTDTFKHVRVYQFHPRVLSFLASDQELEPERLILQTGRPMVDDQNHNKNIGIPTAEALLAGLAFDDQGLEILPEKAKLSPIISRF
jgi:predicted membrane-bound spermidine synthase